MYPRRLLFLLPPETAHRVATTALDALAPLFRRPTPQHPVEVFGLRFPNPVGLAAGFDKNARHLPGLAGLGFGFLEVGSVTARPWAGNPRPRLFRLPADGALINRMGLNNDGAEAVA
ncbi:MAG: dihydroorotate dehydrogenase (quinone), partial [Myxococcales bacterium]|nr:dihydroorotate dehydrogenase (quinone) [Myxococcales bacterium]